VLEAMVPFALLAVIASITFGWIAHLAFWAPWYRWGIRILRVDGLELPLPAESLGTAIETHSGKFKVHALDLVLVRSRQRMFGNRNAGWAVGTIEWRDGSAVFQSRLEPSYLVFVVYFFTIWFASGAAESFASGVSTEFLNSVLPAVILMTVVTGVNVALGRSRMRMLLEEYQSWIGGDSPVSELASEPEPEASDVDSW